MSEEQTPILVNGEAVSEAMVRQELHMLRERYARELSPEEMQRRQAKIESDARENAVERLLLTQKARTVVENVRPAEIEARFAALQNQHGGAESFAERFQLQPGDEQRIKEDIADGVRLETYFDLVCKEVPRPVEADSRAYYEAHPAEFMVPETVHAAHIVQHPSMHAPTERVYAELLNVRERLRNGADFETVAKECSHCQDGGHDLGYFARGQMVESFERVAFATPVGETSDVFQTEFGYHILKVFDRRPAAARPFAEVRYDIEVLLFDERKNEAIGAVADELRAQADIRNLVVVEA